MTDAPPNEPPAADPDPAAEPQAQSELREALARSEATAADNWNRYLRAVAELDNVRKRAARDVEQARRTGMEKLAGELLGVLDSLEMGLESGASATTESLLAGKQATLRLLRTAFERFGVEVIDPAGERFDPRLHEAMGMQPSAGAEPGSVLVVLQRGYRINDRLLRPARVIVAGEPVQSGETRPGADG
jgi:molecular chaperone GrpE